MLKVFKPLYSNPKDLVLLRNPFYETTYFSFGSFDWSLTLHPAGQKGNGKATLQLFRQTSFDQTCHVRLNVSLSRGDNRVVATETIEHLVDTSGHCEPYELLGSARGESMNGIGAWMMAPSKDALNIQLDLLSCTTISLLELCPFDRNKNRAYLYDRDKQAWMIESDVSQGHLTLRLFYTDIRHVPRGHLRYVSWLATLLPCNSGANVTSSSRNGGSESASSSGICGQLPVGSRPSWNYYVQQDIDEGFDMVTNLSTNEVGLLL